MEVIGTVALVLIALPLIWGALYWAAKLAPLLFVGLVGVATWLVAAGHW